MLESFGSAPQPACKMYLVPTSYALLLIAASSALSPVVEARPYLLLNNPRPKCIEVTATEGTSVVVRYEAPDLVALDGLDEDGTSDRINADITTANLGPDEARKDAANKDRGGSGLDQQWNKRAQEAKKGTTKATDMGIQITEKGDETVSQARSRHRFAKFKKEGRQKPPNKINQDITAPTGTVIMEATRGGAVEICVQSLSASHARPSLLHLSVTEDLTEKREQEREQSDKRHMSHLEKTVRGLIRRVAMIQKTADQTKDQEYQFHQTTLQMNRAIKVWPVVHCIMLAVTGLFMAKHISTYLQGHHIY